MQNSSTIRLIVPGASQKNLRGGGGAPPLHGGGLIYVKTQIKVNRYEIFNGFRGVSVGYLTTDCMRESKRQLARMFVEQQRSQHLLYGVMNVDE